MKPLQRRDYLAYPIWAAIFLGIFAICHNVFLYGDDFAYRVFSQGDLAYYIGRNVEHYSMANGRAVVHLLATAFLDWPLVIWQIWNGATIVGCIVVMMKLSRSKNWALSAGICGFLFFSIHIFITRQSIYWLVGSFNYVYPMLMLLLFWWAIVGFLEGKSKGKLLPLLAFFAAATTEQGSVMCFGLAVLYWLKIWIFDKEKPSKILIFSAFASLLGILSVVCAPGVGARIAQTPTEESGLGFLLSNFTSQLQTLFFADFTVKFHLYILGFAGLYGFYQLFFEKTVGRKLGLCLWRFGIPALLGFGYCYLAKIRILGVIPWIALVCYLGFLVTVSVVEIQKSRNFIPLFALILGYGSQFMMVVSPVYGPRILVSLIFVMMVFLVSIFGDIPVKTKVYVPVCLILCLLFAVAFWGDFKGYAINGEVYGENLANLEQENYTQKKLPLPQFGWVMPYDNDYYDPYYNLCYELPQKTEILWVD